VVLLFIEFPEQLQQALDILKTHSNYIIVAGNVTVAAYLESQGIEFVNLDAELDYNAYFNISRQEFEKLEKVCNELDKIIQTSNPVAKKFNITPFLYNYYYLKILLDYLNWIYHCCDFLIKKYKPTNIIYFYRAKLQTNELEWRTEETVVGYVLKNCFSLLNITEINCINEANNNYGVMQDNYSKPIHSIISISMMQRIYNKVIREIKAIYNKKFDKNYFSIHPLISISVANKCKLRKIDISSLAVLKYPYNTNNCIKKSDEIFDKFQEYFDKNFVKILRVKIEKCIIAKIDNYINYYINSINLIEKYNPRFLEMSVGLVPEHKILAQAFKKKNKKVFILQHGAMGQHPEKMFYYVDLLVATDYLVYGQGVKNYIKVHYPNLPLNIHVVGNNKLKEINRKLEKSDLCKIFNFNPKLPTFIFQIPGVFHHFFYNCFNSEGDFVEYQNLKKIVMKFEQNRNIQLILKFHSDKNSPKNSIELYISKLNLPNVKIVRDIHLSTLTNAGDYFITNRPSTGMFEAMYLKKPIIAYNSVIKFWGEDETLTHSSYYFTKFENVLNFFENKAYLNKMSQDYTLEYIQQFVDSGNFEANIESLYKKLV